MKEYAFCYHITQCLPFSCCFYKSQTFQGGCRLPLPGPTLSLTGWSGVEFYYPSSQGGTTCLGCCPSRYFRPSVNMFSTVLWPFHRAVWRLLKLLSLDITPDIKIQNPGRSHSRLCFSGSLIQSQQLPGVGSN